MHLSALVRHWLESLPRLLGRGTDPNRNMAVIPIDSIVHGAHLLPIFNETPLDCLFNYTHSLDIFKVFM